MLSYCTIHISINLIFIILEAIDVYTLPFIKFLLSIVSGTTYIISNNNPENRCYFFHFFQENQGSERLLLAQIYMANKWHSRELKHK